MIELLKLIKDSKHRVLLITQAFQNINTAENRSMVKKMKL